MKFQEATERELARFVLDKAGSPVDQFAVAVILETCGIRDVDAVRKFGRKNIFDLAGRIYDCCQATLTDVPELTVCMTAYNDGRHIGETVESVLHQEGVDFELVIIDDGSEDNTVEVVQSFEDLRVKLIRNKNHRGLAHCYNLAIEQSRSPFIAFVKAHGLVLHSALEKMVQKLKSSPDIGQVNCYSLLLYEDVRVTGDLFSQKTNLLPKNIIPGMGCNRGLLDRGSITNHLRMYRREALIVSGKFYETLKYGLDYDIALRIVDKYDIKLVPEFLYCSRGHESGKTKLLHFNGVGSWFQRLVFLRLLLKDRKINFLRPKKNKFNKFMIVSLCCILRLANMLFSTRRVIKQ